MSESQLVNKNVEIVSVDVAKKKSKIGGVGKLFAYLFAGCGILLAGLLCLTIVGILPAIPIFFGSVGLLYLANGQQQIACPHCNKKQAVFQVKENFECTKCRQLTVINWK